MENQKHHYSGLTDAEVLESRRKNGVNILTPPEKETVWDKIKEACTHWIVLSLLAVLVGTIIAAGCLAGSMGTIIWVMPMIVFASTFLIIIVGFFGGFEDPLFKILITAFVLSMAISIYEFEWVGVEWTTFFEPIGIIVALILATGVAFVLESKNEKTFQSLNEVNDDTLVKVIRNDNVCQVPRKDVVVGDIVILNTGEEIPADCELLDGLTINVNESTLTGELSCHKTCIESEFDKDATYPSNHLMKGTTILQGYCTARVFAVGDATACGKVFEAAQVDEGEPTPLSEKLDSLADWITKASYVIAGLIVVGRLLRYFIGGDADFSTSQGWIDFVSYLLSTIMIAVTLIVVAVPEGLPMSVTLSLAFSMRKLMKENTLPRTMHACETMGATSVICTDKTGTLTQNQMQVADTFFPNLSNQQLGQDEISQFIKESIAANTTANLDYSDKNKIKAIGSPTESALLLWLHNANENYLPIRESVEIKDRVPFSTEIKYMATVVNSQVVNSRVLYVTGAPDILLNLCGETGEERQAYESKLVEYQNQAYRTLGLAYAVLRDDDNVILDGKLIDSRSLRMMGVVAISDPIRPEVPDAIKECMAAGIDVKIVTGDTVGTAKEIGRQVGLYNDADSEDALLAANEFAAMSDEEALNRIDKLKILWRARPNDKERLVKLLKQKDAVVAVTGDGTNDAPALNAADVGLSMGDGTAVAKEASDMTILDNSLKTISNAVMWGRSLYENIQRFLLFQLTVNVSACFIVLVGAFIGTKSPLTVTQMLWVNLIMDTFAAIALASLPPTRKVMEQKPRDRKESILDKSMKTNIFGIGGLFFLIQLVLLLVFENAEVTSLADFLNITWVKGNGLSAYEGTLFFTVFVMTHFWYLFDARAYKTGKSAFHFKGCQGFIAIAAVILIGQIAMLYVPGFNDMFNCVPLSMPDFLIITALSSLVMWCGELVRMIKK
ncbi:MAG: calcium-translocating P-type ATPase, PMCA-type [Bacteroidales bacterium]|nr:calcium-translocating P-type ATPase, PMCA-type [Bacteroidales bacterium]